MRSLRSLVMAKVVIASISRETVVSFTIFYHIEDNKLFILQVLERQVCPHLYDFFCCLYTYLLPLKSTTAAALATILGVPLLSLDTVMWKPGWSMTSPEEFQAKLRSYMDQHQETGWVADGDYMRRGGLIMHEEATDVVCE